jgi:hypothetical protein
MKSIKGSHNLMSKLVKIEGISFFNLNYFQKLRKRVNNLSNFITGRHLKGYSEQTEGNCKFLNEIKNSEVPLFLLFYCIFCFFSMFSKKIKGYLRCPLHPLCVHLWTRD